MVALIHNVIGDSVTENVIPPETVDHVHNVTGDPLMPIPKVDGKLPHAMKVNGNVPSGNAIDAVIAINTPIAEGKGPDPIKSKAPNPVG